MGSSGIPASALRFYEEKGLIASIGRRGLRRVFEANVLQRLALVGVGRAAGFSLEDIGQMFAADGKLQIDRRMLATKADEIDALVKKLGAMRDGLRHAAACPAPNHMECPSFQRIMRLVTSQAKAGRSRGRARAAPIPRS